MNSVTPLITEAADRAAKRMRPHSTTLAYEGVELQVLYEEHGAYLPSSDIDDECRPTCRITNVLIGGVEVWRDRRGPSLLTDRQIDELEQQIERGWL